MIRYFVIRKKHIVATSYSSSSEKSTVAGKLFSRLRGLRPIYVLIKIIMVLILLYTTAIFSSLLTQSKNLLKNQKVWDDSAKDIYVLQINDVGQDIETGIEIDVQKRISKLYGYLCDNNNAFFMDAEDYFAYKQYGGDVDINGLLTDGFYTHITVSPNYFLHNPINTINDNNVLDEVIISKQVLNILVPESLMYLQKQYEEQFLDYFDFYCNKVYRTIYSHETDATWETIPVEKMKINIIPVKNDQWYFTFSADINESSFNSIIDPVVVVYTDNFHPSTTLAMSSSCLYFENNSSIDSINSKMEEITGLKGFVYSESIQQKEHKRIADAQKVLIIGLCLIIYITVTIIAAIYLNSCFAKHKILFALNVFTVILPYIILLATLQLKSYRVIRIIRRLPLIVSILIVLALLMYDIFCLKKENERGIV